MPPTQISGSPWQSAWNSTSSPKLAPATGSFAVGVGDLIVVEAVNENGDTLNTPTNAASGAASITWTLLRNIGTANASCRAAVWEGQVTAAGNVQVSVSETATGSADRYGMIVWAYPAGSHGGVGQVVGGSGTGTPPSLTPAFPWTAHSMVCAANGDWTASSHGTTRAYLTNLGAATERNYASVDSNYTTEAWEHADTGASPSSGAVGLSGPNMTWSMVAVEVLAPATGATQQEATGAAAVVTAATGAATARSERTATSGILTGATGQATARTAASATAALTTTATGQATARPVASGMATIATSVTGQARAQTEATGTAGLVVAASGQATVPVAASAIADVTTLATGAATAKLETSGTAAITTGASGSGSVPGVEQATGTATILVSATGTLSTTVQATGAAALAVGATGHAGIVQASGSAAIVTQAAAAGTATSRATGNATAVLIAAGFATVPVMATGEAALVVTGSAEATLGIPEPVVFAPIFTGRAAGGHDGAAHGPLTGHIDGADIGHARTTGVAP